MDYAKRYREWQADQRRSASMIDLEDVDDVEAYAEQREQELQQAASRVWQHRKQDQSDAVAILQEAEAETRGYTKVQFRDTDLYFDVPQRLPKRVERQARQFRHTSAEELERNPYEMFRFMSELVDAVYKGDTRTDPPTPTEWYEIAQTQGYDYIADLFECIMQPLRDKAEERQGNLQR